MVDNIEVETVGRALAKVLSDGQLDENELYALADIETPEGIAALLDAAAEITAAFVPRKFDSCTIVNARSGKCSENCKWCAQSAHYQTGCDTYEIVGHEEAIAAARYNAERGVGRYSLVASGRTTHGAVLDELCHILEEVNAEGRIDTCASLGLLDAASLRKLYDSGCHRYHCNLETSPTYFGKLCSTHTIDDKIATIKEAKRIGFEVCSGGIIGMGETRRQRAELALKLREVEPVSIPINILAPIKGTPLQDTPLISDEEILIAVALFRFAHPRVTLRFAGGRSRLSHNALLRAMKVGVNGAIVGDLLTTIGSTIDQDKALVAEAGYQF